MLYQTAGTEAKVEVEEAGPIRAVIKTVAPLLDQDGNRLFRIEKRIEALEEDLGFLSLLVLSILEALEEKETITSGDVLGIMQEMDVLDGVVDGKVNVQVLRDLHKTSDSQ